MSQRSLVVQFFQWIFQSLNTYIYPLVDFLLRFYIAFIVWNISYNKWLYWDKSIETFQDTYEYISDAVSYLIVGSVIIFCFLSALLLLIGLGQIQR